MRQKCTCLTATVLRLLVPSFFLLGLMSSYLHRKPFAQTEKTCWRLLVLIHNVCEQLRYMA
jgi:hypothetical protein